MNLAYVTVTLSNLNSDPSSDYHLSCWFIASFRRKGRRIKPGKEIQTERYLMACQGYVELNPASNFRVIYGPPRIARKEFAV